MKDLKVFQVVIMGVFGLIAVAGIFLFANFKGFSGGETSLGKVTIWGTFPSDTMNQALDAMKQGHPEFAGISYVARPEGSFNEDLAEAIASGQGPDLVIISQEQLLEARNKLATTSASVRTFRDTYLPVTELFLSGEGATYGVPFVIDPLVLYYNRPVLSSAGAARPPSTWEAVSGLSASVNRQTEAQTIVQSLIALGTYENVDNARGILSLLFLQSGGAITEMGTDGYRGAMTRGTNEAFGAIPAESALNFYTEFANPGKTVYSWNRSLPKSRDAFLAGDLALYLGYASERALLAAANPNLDFDMAPVPAPQTMTTRITYARAYAFALPRSSKNMKGAYGAALALSDKSMLPSIAHALGMAPAKRALLVPAKNDLYEPVYFPEALIARGWLSPGPSETDRIFATMVGNVISGRQNPREAISTADQALSAALR